MFRTCFVARLVGDQDKSAEIFCRFEPAITGETKLPDLPTAQNLGSFCYPVGPNNVKPREYGAPEEFSFTLTGGDGTRTHGFCRTFLPPRSRTARPNQNINLRYPQVVCIISKYLWLPFYFKVLQVVEALLKQGDLLTGSAPPQMPLYSPASLFLADLLNKAGSSPPPGRILRVDMPPTARRISVSPPRRLSAAQNSYMRSAALQCSDKFMELEVPPDCGNGLDNAGVPLAKLLFYLQEQPLMTLIEALLLERRILMLAADGDRVSAAVHAAAALIFPFRWQHIYLPLLPHALQDYLLAPMPYLVGVPAANSFAALQHTPLDEVMLVDLDQGTCTPGSSLPPATPSSLPYAEELAAHLQVYTASIRSPAEYDSTPAVSALMQSYFLKLLFRYRDFIEPEAEPADPSGNHINHQHSQSLPSPAQPRSAAQRPAPPPEDDSSYLRAYGWRFDQRGLVASHRRQSTRAFLEAFRHSQMYEVFITERLHLASRSYATKDAFEARVVAEAAAGRRSKQIKQIVSVGVQKGVSKGVGIMKRARHSVKSLRHSIGGADELHPLPTPHSGPLGASRIATAASLPVAGSQGRSSPTRSQSAFPSQLAATTPSALPLRPPAEESERGQEATASAAPSAAPIMSGAMAETAAFFSLDEDSGSEDDSPEGSRRPVPVITANRQHAHHSSLPLHLEFPLAIPDPALSPTSRPANAPTFAPGGSLSLLDMDYDVPAMAPEASGLSAITSEDEEGIAHATPATSVHLQEAAQQGEGGAPLQPSGGSDALSSSRQPGPEDLQAASIRQLASLSVSRSVSDDSPFARPSPGFATPPPLPSGPSGSFGRVAQGDPLSAINPISEPKPPAPIPMARQGSQTLRSASGPLSGIAPVPADKGLLSEPRFSRTGSEGSTLPPAVLSSLQDIRSSSQSEGLTERLTRTTSTEAGSICDSPPAGQHQADAAASLASPPAAHSPEWRPASSAPPEQQAIASTSQPATGARRSGSRSQVSFMDPLSSIDPFSRSLAPSLQSPVPTASPVVDKGRDAQLDSSFGADQQAPGGSRAARTLTWTDFGQGSLSSPLHMAGSEQQAGGTAGQGPMHAMQAQRLASSGSSMPATPPSHSTDAGMSSMDAPHASGAAARLPPREERPSSIHATAQGMQVSASAQTAQREPRAGKLDPFQFMAPLVAEPSGLRLDEGGGGLQQSDTASQTLAPARDSMSLLDL